MYTSFQKSLKRATALALVFAASYPTSLSASNVRVQSWDGINEDDSLITIAGRGISIQRTLPNNGILGINPSRTETVPYSYGVEVAETDLTQVKNSVIASDLLAYPEKSDVYEDSSKGKIRQAFSRSPLRELDPISFHNLMKSIPSDIFKAAQNHLSKGRDRNEWALDETLGGYITFARNKNGKISVIIKDLNVVLPLFKDQRLAEMDSWIPSGVVPSKLQQDTASLFSLILLNQPNKLKKGVQYRLQNQQEPLGDAWYYIENGKKKPLELPLVVQIDAYAEKRKAFDKRYIEAYLLPILYDVYPAECYKTYDAFINYKGSGYKHGMNMDDYWQLWLNSRYGEKAKKHVLPKYELPIDLIRDRQTYDRQFIEKILLPTILEFYPYDPYKFYRDFIKPNNGSGYKVGMDINKYWDSWLNSRYRAAVEKRPLKVYQPPLV